MFAIPASYDERTPLVTVSAKKETFVNLQTNLSLARHYVGDNSSHTFTVADIWRVSNGLESKGLEITSDEPVSVYIGTEMQWHRIPDDIMVRPITADDTEYIISSYPGISSGSSSEYWPNSYFMIIPQFDESLVQVLNFKNDIWAQQYSVVLNKFDVFTHDSFYANDGYTDYTGWRVVATQPVAVISGHGYAYFGDVTRHTCDSMLSTSVMGVHYVTFPVFFGLGTEGYVVRIVGSTAEDITVVIPDIGVDDIIPRGGFLEVKSVVSSKLMTVSYISNCYTDYILKIITVANIK